jgi:hypothetical protein
MTKIIQKTGLILLMMTALATPLKSQSDYMVPADSLKTKFEVGMNIAPFVQGLIGGQFSDPLKWSAIVKMYKNERRIFRVGIQYYQSTYLSTDDFGPYENYVIVSQTDSTQIRRVNYQAPKNRLQLSVGGEHTWGERRLKQFAGIDIIAGHYVESRNTMDHPYIYDTTSVTFPNGAGIWNPDPNSPSSKVENVYGHMFYVGLSPFYGIKTNLGKRLSLTAQVGPDLAFSFGKIDRDDYLAGTTDRYSIFGFDYNMYTLVSDLSLYYKF